MTGPRPTILVVDDEPLLRKIMSEWMVFEGYRVLTAEHGVDALGVLEANQVDVIVSDFRMPVMDGITFLKALRVAGGDSPPVVFVSGFAETNAREAHDLGVEVVLSKPFTDDGLLSAVRRVLIPRDELWRSPAETPAAQNLKATWPSVDSARHSGHLSFGRGGFCLRSPATALRAAPVQFALNFTDQPLRIAGHGTVRWIQRAEEQIGVEITGLEAACLTEGIRLTAGARCYIPRTSAS